MSVIHKTAVTTNQSGLRFWFSSASRDSYGDEVVQRGIMLDTFLANPVCLWAHRSSEPPIGTWSNVGIEQEALQGTLELAPRGTSDRIDEIRKLAEHKIIKSCSIGFIPLESEPIPGGTGRRYTKSRLLEVSLCAIPANSDAMAMAQKMHISPQVMSEVFVDTTLAARRAEWQRTKAQALATIDRINSAQERWSKQQFIDEPILTYELPVNRWPLYRGWKGSYTGWRGDRGGDDGE